MQDNRTISNGIKLELDYVFGCPNNKRDPYMFFYTDEKKLEGKTEMLVIPNGRKFLGYATKDLKMSFLKGEIERASMTALGSTIVKGIEAFALAIVPEKEDEGASPIPKVVIHIPKKEKKYTLYHDHLP